MPRFIVLALLLMFIAAQAVSAQSPDDLRPIAADRLYETELLWSIDSQGRLESIVWHPNGGSLYVTSEHGLFAYDAADWSAPPERLSDAILTRLQVDADGMIYGRQGLDFVRLDAEGRPEVLLSGLEEVLDGFSMGYTLSPDSRYVALVGCVESAETAIVYYCTRSRLILFSLDDGALVYERLAEPNRTFGFGVVFTPDGSGLALPDEGGYRIIDLPSGETRCTMQPQPAQTDSPTPGPLTDLQLSPDQTRWLTGGDRFTVWDVATCERLWESAPHFYDPNPYIFVEAFTWLDDAHVAAGGINLYSVQRVGSEANTMRPAGTKSALNAQPSQMQCSPDGRWLAVFSPHDGEIALIDMQADDFNLEADATLDPSFSDADAAILSGFKPLTRIAVNPVSLDVLVSDDVTLRLYEGRTGALKATAKLGTNINDGPRQVAFSGDGTRLYVNTKYSPTVAVSPEDRIHILDAATLTTLEIREGGRFLALDAERDWAVVTNGFAPYGQRVIDLNAAPGEDLIASISGVNGLYPALSPDGRVLVTYYIDTSSSSDAEVRAYALDAPDEPIWRETTLGDGAKFSPDGRYLLIRETGIKGTRIYEAQDWADPESWVQAAMIEDTILSQTSAFLPTNRLLTHFTGTDHILGTWDLENVVSMDEISLMLPDNWHITGVVTSPDGRLLVVNAGNNRVMALGIPAAP